MKMKLIRIFLILFIMISYSIERNINKKRQKKSKNRKFLDDEYENEEYQNRVTHECHDEVCASFCKSKSERCDVGICFPNGEYCQCSTKEDESFCFNIKYP
jgi:hypothetical protein